MFMYSSFTELNTFSKYKDLFLVTKEICSLKISIPGYKCWACKNSFFSRINCKKRIKNISTWLLPKKWVVSLFISTFQKSYDYHQAHSLIICRAGFPRIEILQKSRYTFIIWRFCPAWGVCMVIARALARSHQGPCGKARALQISWLDLGARSSRVRAHVLKNSTNFSSPCFFFKASVSVSFVQPPFTTSSTIVCETVINPTRYCGLRWHFTVSLFLSTINN